MVEGYDLLEIENAMGRQADAMERQAAAMEIIAAALAKQAGLEFVDEGEEDEDE